ncbi:DoxX family protein [Afifella pfennigii]|uniref:DoxX family protein n=1 Tax=Afifella pfennigii TaxID=209897 RepID=UPI00054D4352|nr:DoxX family protein [Afifella pfennigii]
MSETRSAPPTASGAAALAELPARLFGLIPMSLVQLVLRLAVAIPFLKSGFLKWDGFLKLSDVAILLFREEFRLHILGATYAFPAPVMMAWMSALAEVILPCLLIAGFGTRLAALGLLVMTGIIQLTEPGGWSNFHLPWAAMLLAILAYGPGKLSLDSFLSRLARWNGVANR